MFRIQYQRMTSSISLQLKNGWRSRSKSCSHSLKTLCSKQNSSSLVPGNIFRTLCSSTHCHESNKRHFSSSMINLSTSDESNASPIWDYSEKFGPNHWPKIWPVGDSQSPINIETSKAMYQSSLKDPSLMFNAESVKWRAFNTGCGVQYEPLEKDCGLVISGGPLKNPYTLEQFHFHWGKTNDVGSEHTIDSRSYAAELHLVHWNQIYSTFANAVDKPNGLAVLGVFLELSDACNPNLGLFLSELDQINFKGKEICLNSSINPYALLPAPHDYYWTYPGSLTTPPLFESVTWIVHKQAMPISALQLNQFRHLKAITEDADPNTLESHPMGKDGCYHGRSPCIAGNHRPLQDLNGRCVEASFDHLKD